jgi:hypothetical protein
MQKNPQRVAWTVLSVAFVSFWVVAIGTPLSIRSFILNAQDSKQTEMQVIGGTVRVLKAGGRAPIAATKELTLEEGDEVITDATSSATLDLFDRSHAIVYSNTDVKLDRTQTPRFRASSRPNDIVLNLTGGYMRVGVPLPGDRSTSFRVVTPHTTIELSEGSYRIDVLNEATQVAVVLGEAIVGEDSERTTLRQGTRSRVGLDGVPSPAVPAVQNLVKNGDFQKPLASSWLTSTVVLSSSVQPANIEVVEDGGRQAVRLVRREEDDGNHTEASIQQRLDQEVRGFDRLELLFDVKLIYQSLPGGGEQSSEFPLIVRLDYKDIWGNDKFWTHGFYYRNERGFPIALDPWGQPFGEQIPRDVWFPFESGNLLSLLGDNAPARITGLKVYASGWNYDAWVSDVQLLVE